MRVLNARELTLPRAWQAVDLARIDDATVRVHWTDRPYRWHVNDGIEVFVVLDGVVDMHHRDGGVEQVTRLIPGVVFVADVGDAHVAHPVGEARILVVERAGSI